MDIEPALEVAVAIHGVDGSDERLALPDCDPGVTLGESQTPDSERQQFGRSGAGLVGQRDKAPVHGVSGCADQLAYLLLGEEVVVRDVEFLHVLLLQLDPAVPLRIEPAALDEAHETLETGLVVIDG